MHARQDLEHTNILLTYLTEVHALRATIESQAPLSFDSVEFDRAFEAKFQEAIQPLVRNLEVHVERTRLFREQFDRVQDSIEQLQAEFKNGRVEFNQRMAALENRANEDVLANFRSPLYAQTLFA